MIILHFAVSIAKTTMSLYDGLGIGDDKEKEKADVCKYNLIEWYTICVDLCYLLGNWTIGP